MTSVPLAVPGGGAMDAVPHRASTTLRTTRSAPDRNTTEYTPDATLRPAASTPSQGHAIHPRRRNLIRQASDPSPRYVEHIYCHTMPRQYRKRQRRQRPERVRRRRTHRERRRRYPGGGRRRIDRHARIEDPNRHVRVRRHLQTMPRAVGEERVEQQPRPSRYAAPIASLKLRVLGSNPTRTPRCDANLRGLGTC